MSTDLEWRFGDELPKEASGRREPKRRPWREWTIWSFVILLVSGGVYVWWHQRQGTLNQAEIEVRQVARLELRALAEGDVELYMSLQDRTDDTWYKAQATYVETAALPLPIQALTTTQTSIESARIVGERAEVEVVHTAALPNGQSASFHAVRLYRYTDDGRWLHTRIEPGAGAGTVLFTGASVELAVFKRDADWVAPLVSSLEDVAVEFCDLVSCRQELPATLELAVGLDEGAAEDDMAWPAPFLVGAPQNQAARDAWAAALQTLLVDRLVAREVGRAADDVAGELLEDRLSAWFMVQLGIDSDAEAAVNALKEAEDSVRRGESWISLQEMFRFPRVDARRPLAEAQVDLLLDFLEREHGLSSVASLMHTLADADDTQDLLGGILDQSWSEFEWRYLSYIREATAERVDDLSSFASYDLVMSCLGLAHKHIELWGLRLGQPSRTLLSAGLNAGPLSPVAWSPDGTYLLLRSQNGGKAYFLLQRGSSGPQRFRSLPEGADYVTLLALGNEGGWSSDGRHIVYRVSGPSPEDGVVDLGTGGRVTLGGSFVAWSPDSTHVIYAEPASWHWTPESDVATFWVQDVESGQAERIGQGYDAAWSPDGSRVALLSSEPALRTHDVETGEIVEWLGKDALRRTLAFTPTLSLAAGRPSRVAWSPDGQRIAVGATRFGEDEPEEALTVVVERASHYPVHSRAGRLYDILWSPDGRWLTAITFGTEQFQSVVRSVEGDLLFAGQNVLVSWSPQGRHMAVVQGELPVRILEIESVAWQAFEAPGRCWPVMWNPRAPCDETTRCDGDLVSWSEGRTSVEACDLPYCRP